MRRNARIRRATSGDRPRVDLELRVRSPITKIFPQTAPDHAGRLKRQAPFGGRNGGMPGRLRH